MAVLGSCVAASALYVVNGGSFPSSLGTTALPSPTATPYSPAVLADSLTAQHLGWSDDSRTCFFQDGSYHVVNGASCFAPAPAMETATVSVHASVVKDNANYQYGVQFWQQPTLSLNCYAFVLDTTGGWMLFKTVNDQDTMLASSKSSAIHRGTGAANTLEVRATAGHIELFVNNTAAGHVEDATFAYGLTALFGDPGGEVAFHTMLVTGQVDASLGTPPGNLLANDPLTADLGNLPPGPNAFQDDGYHMTGSSISPYGYNEFADVNIAVTARHTDGASSDDLFGIALRHKQGGNAYLFTMSPDGRIVFLKLANHNFTTIAAFKPGVITRIGIGAVNTLQVRAKDPSSSAM